MFTPGKQHNTSWPVSMQDHGSEFLVLVQQATGREDSCRYPLVQGKAHACRAWSRSLNILNSNGPRREHLKFEAHVHPENPFLFSTGSGRHRPSELSQRKAPPGIKIKSTIRINNALYLLCCSQNGSSIWSICLTRIQAKYSVPWSTKLSLVDACRCNTQSAKHDRVAISSYRADRGISKVGIVSILGSSPLNSLWLKGQSPHN